MNQLIAIAAAGCLTMMGAMMVMTLRSNESSTSTAHRNENRLLPAEIDRLNLEPASKANNAAAFGNGHREKMLVHRAFPDGEPWPPRLM
ncbi:MAG TPA: hypothetical protein VGC05_21000 [Mycobacterium sp.]